MNAWGNSFGKAWGAITTVTEPPQQRLSAGGGLTVTRNKRNKELEIRDNSQEENDIVAFISAFLRTRK